MNNTLLESIHQSDGRYLSDAELRPLAQFVTSYETRLAAYTDLQQNSEALVLSTLRRLMQTSHRKTVQEHGPKCRRDMAYTLECVAKAVLLDDDKGFIEDYVVWMQNITRSLHKETSAIEAYRALQQDVTAALSSESAALVNKYLDLLIQALTTVAVAS